MRDLRVTFRGAAMYGTPSSVPVPEGLRAREVDTALATALGDGSATDFWANSARLRQHVGHFNARDFCHAHSAEGFLVTDRGQTSSGLPHRFVAAIANQKTLCLTDSKLLCRVANVIALRARR